MSACALINARLIDGTGAPARDGRGLIIEDDGQIGAVGAADSLQIGPETKVFDAGGRTVMPGLIDAHTHLTYHAKEYALILQQMNESLEFNVSIGVQN